MAELSNLPGPRRLALISGGSAGLGMALCQQLLAEGWQVREFSRSAPHAHSVRADFADPLQACAAVDGALAPLAAQPWDTVWAIGNAASLQPIGPVARQEPAELLLNLSVNFSSAILFFSRVIGAFQAAPGHKRLASISSGAALRGVAGWSLYGAAKAGLDHFVRTLAVEQDDQAHPWLPINIDPGVMDTAMQAGIRAAELSDFPERERYVKRHADGELRPAADVARAIRRLLEIPGLLPGSRHAAADHLAR